MHPDLALITSGGGMTCAYSAGSILALKDRGIITPGWAIGSSGSTGTLAYYVSGQYHCFRNIWEKLLAVKEFIDFKRVKRIIDIDYLIDDVCKKLDPLDIEAIKRSPTELLMTATNYKTGQIKYFSNRDNVDIFEALRASKAMPFVYGKRVNLNGDLYLDGALVGSVATNTQEAVRRGARKIIVIDNTPPRFWGFADKAISFSLSQNIGKAMRKASKNPSIIKVADVKIIYIKPSRPLPVSLLDNKSEHIRDTIDIGYADMAGNKELEEFL